MSIKWIVIAILAALFAYIRLAPTPPARWNIAAPAQSDTDFEGGVIRVIDGTPDTLAKLEAIILATPRTTLLTRDKGTGRATYVTRSLIWGFPDYATVQLSDGRITLWSRLRFGRSDMGVNAARVTAWLDALRQET